MEVHSPRNSVVAKRLWNILRIAFFMMRKGLTSKRKLIMDMNLMMKRGKLIKKSLANLMFHHHSKDTTMTHSGFGAHEYEFSCSNSPNPVFFHVTKRKHNYFPCISLPEEPDEPNAIVVLPPKIDCSPEYSFNFRLGTPNFAPGDTLSPLKSPFSIRVSNYSQEDDNDSCNNTRQVDVDAEDFIRRFYDQLRVQSRTQLLQYQEMQYQEMLARGT